MRNGSEGKPGPHRIDDPVEAEGHNLKWHETRQFGDFPSIMSAIFSTYLLSTVLVAVDKENIR